MAASRETEECPECGTEFRKGRLACPECGSDAETGWKSEADIQYESVEIPDTYEELVATGTKRDRRKQVFLVAAILALIGMLLFVLGR
jgi:uncharacterized Zn finger protein (UPF0148 family)